MSIKKTVLGFKLTTLRTRVSSHNHCTFLLLRLPVVKVNMASLLGGKRSKRSVVKRRSANDDPWFESGSDGFFSEDEFQFTEFDPSVSYYPSPYCGIVEGI